MPAPTPDEVRLCVVRMLNLGYDIPTIMAIVDRSETTVKLIKKQWEAAGTYRRPETYGIVGRPRILGPGDVWYMADRLAQSPDLFLGDLQEELSITGVDVSIPTIQRALNRFGFTFKQLDKRAMEQCEEDRVEFRHSMQAFRPSQLVFADESSINRKGMYRSRGYAICGQRAYKRAWHVRGKRYSILPAMSIKGMLTALIVKGSFNAPLFLEFIDLCLAHMNPFPADNSVLVIDNCQIHNGNEVQAKCDARGVVLMYLPSYSPDFNPIELAFSKIKGDLRREGEETRGTLSRVDEDSEQAIEAMLMRHIFAVTEDDARGWFEHAGYTEVDG
ncbi:DDE superfamily endonuclease [Ceratobasidium sp. AG-Ba]|nr:DDE superfamily endonuclease [Ceratobasidium sp. AG-Ba]